MNKPLRIFIDDIREAPAPGWIVVRTISDAIRLLHTRTIEEASIDHDIFCTEDVKNVHLSRESFEPVVRFILAMPKERRPRCIRIHSANEEASIRMLKLLNGNVEVLRRCPPINGGMSFRHW